MNIVQQRNEDLQRWAEAVDKLKVGMLITQEDNGTLRGRPLTPLEIDATPTVWFLISGTAPVTHDVKDNRQVCLTFAHPTGDYVTISGTATISQDPDRLAALWTPHAQAYFPGGPADPDLRALAVTVHEAEYWDTPDGTLRRVLSYARAVATNAGPAAMGEHHKVLM
ncbi:MAG: pyridoxamine 5'-phosphate oxidase family protein [Steroidobacteraceae bacterium]